MIRDGRYSLKGAGGRELLYEYVHRPVLFWPVGHTSTFERTIVICLPPAIYSLTVLNRGGVLGIYGSEENKKLLLFLKVRALGLNNSVLSIAIVLCPHIDLGI